MQSNFTDTNVVVIGLVLKLKERMRDIMGLIPPINKIDNYKRNHKFKLN